MNQVALTELLLLMEPCQLVSLSLCSKRVNKLVKIYGRKKSIIWKLHMIQGARPRVTLWNIHRNVMLFYNVLEVSSISKLSPDIKEVVEISNHKVPVVSREKNFLITYWEDRILGLKTIIDYVSDLFSIDVKCVNLKKESLWMIEWVKSRQAKPLEQVHVETNDIFNGEEYASLIRSFHGTKSFGLFTNAPRNFRYTDQISNCKTVTISDGHWITIDSLLSMDCVDFSVRNAKLTNQEINRFVKNWLAGGSHRLEFLTITAAESTLDREQVLGDGLEEIVEEIEEAQKYQRGTPFDHITEKTRPLEKIEIGNIVYGKKLELTYTVLENLVDNLKSFNKIDLHIYGLQRLRDSKMRWSRMTTFEKCLLSNMLTACEQYVKVLDEQEQWK